MDDAALEQVKSVMAETVRNIKKVMGNDANNQALFIGVLSKLLHGIISTVADHAETASQGAKSAIYADIEASARIRGFNAIDELDAQYSISDIEPDDLPNAINYLGKAMSTALFKGLYELPKPLQTQEILLRAIESLLANLLHQKFNDPNDPHAILDSFCEHIHMALRDLEKTSGVTQSNMKDKSSLNKSIISIVERIDKRAKEILVNGGDEALLLSLHNVMGEIKEVMDASTTHELDMYYEKYPGFYEYMCLLSQLAQGISDGTIEVSG
jgi:hypothetical protein